MADKLGAIGTAPPTAIKTGGRRTASTRAGSSKMGTMDIKMALTQELIVKMREKFAPLFGTDVKTQEQIAKQVTIFMNTTASVTETELATLESQISAVLQGLPASSAPTRVPLKRPVLHDEWADLTSYEAKQNALDNQAKEKLRREKARILKAELDAQVQQRKELDQKEQNQEDMYHEDMLGDLRKWENEQIAKKEKKLEMMSTLMKEREEQAQEKRGYEERAAFAKKAEEAEMRARLKQEFKQKLEDEKARLEKGKFEMGKLKEANELNKKMQLDREEEARKEDLRYQKLFAEKLEREDMERKAKVEKLKNMQNQMAAFGEGRGPAKRFMPDEIIEKNFQDREAKLDLMEAAKKDRIAAGNLEMRQALAKQLSDKKSSQAMEEEKEAKRVEAFLAGLSAQERAEYAKKEKKLARSLAHKKELEAQMKKNAVDGGSVTMSGTEKAFNKNYLETVGKFNELGLQIDTSTRVT